MVEADSTARTIGAVIALGAALVVGVVAVTLARSTYRADVDAICHAEQRSGYSLETDMTEVTRWLREHLTTPAGNQLHATLGYAPLEDRASMLQRQAQAERIDACPTVDAFERLARGAAYRRDLQDLCSSATFPGLVDAADVDRRSRLIDWIEIGSRSPRTRELTEPLRGGSPADAAERLRATATAARVFSCDVARVLLAPPTVVPPAVPSDAGDE